MTERQPCPKKAIIELLSIDGTRTFTITEKQFFGLMKGWTHLGVMDEKSIVENVYETGFESNKTCYIHCPTCKQTITTHCNIPEHVERTELLESLCTIDLVYYTWGEKEAEDVGKCDGVSCNYCGRFKEE
jgi:hypothetical protein